MEEAKVEAKDGTISVASAFAGHQQAVQDSDHKFLTQAVEEAYKGVDCVTMSSGSRKRPRSRIGKIDEDKAVSLSDGPVPSVNLNENVSAFGEFGDGRNLGGLIEETVKSCVSPLIKEMMNGTTGMMMAAVGGFPGGGGAHAMGVLSPMLMPSVNPLGFGGGGVGDERWRRQQILELEVYSRRLELVQEQIRATVNELKTMPSGG
ncbi:hypothetical protein F2Q69_00056154 [Brassica cretica]|uniref:Uncharacterized protein n=1 Tax=Brassica cretica TaxID=69181 RepID=A0A8S9N3C9_BRACR|nr:hypothetical protein F2Q69_00056154 [Brassica cretica]